MAHKLESWFEHSRRLELEDKNNLIRGYFCIIRIIQNNMATLEQKILLTSDDIDQNIDQLLVTGRGFVSRNVLKQLRVLMDQIAVLVHLNDLNSEVAYHTQIIPALTFIRQQGQYRFFNDFYEKLNAYSL